MPERVLARLDSHTVPASSWADTEPYRGEIRLRHPKDTQEPMCEAAVGWFAEGHKPRL